jgi:acetylornithine deacetylase/succinyl-diaminopimelate desuccinylase-like protein
MSTAPPPDPVELLRELIRFDTTNPPGNEGPCIDHLRDLLEAAGCSTEPYALDPARPNLVSRLRGGGDASPLLLYGHVDVVTTDGQRWAHPPFEARLVDGEVWGRGALDMKSGVAMMVSAFVAAAARSDDLPGDVILAILSDEENLGEVGARFLVEQHPELFEGVRFALGEVGGSPMHLGGRRFYMIEVAEKQVCWLKATIHGPGGHGALPHRGGTMARLASLLGELDRARLPMRVTPAAVVMIETMAGAADDPLRTTLLALLDPDTADAALAELPSPQDRLFEALLRNTVNATVVTGGSKINVIPSEVELQLDGRLVPGATPEDLLEDLAPLLGDDVEVAVLRHDAGPREPDLGLFETLGEVVRELDPGGVAVPMLLIGVTDGRYFSRLGIQTYGFLPLDLPEDFPRTLAHAADERVPASALAFGTEAIARVLHRFGSMTAGSSR